MEARLKQDGKLIEHPEFTNRLMDRVTTLEAEIATLRALPPTVEEILLEWVDGGSYGKDSHFIREFSKVALNQIAALHETIATLRADATKAAEEIARLREENISLRQNLLQYQESFWGTDRRCKLLEADLARERERHQDLRRVVKKYREQCYHCFEGITCEVCVLAEPLLEPQPAPVATADGG